ncbi:MAG TPA: CopG family antitoxin [Bdellovibrionota bacterium]|nr:CopG family antitoxin [Bdellovibrionota bacterium]
MKRQKAKRKPMKEIKDYDRVDTSAMINQAKPLKFEDIGLKLPEIPPTQVVSIRLPSELLNELRAIGSQRDIPYQALIKLFLSQSVVELKKKLA